MLSRKLIAVKESSIHGFGVFAEEDIQEGEVIEECYVLTYPKHIRELRDYEFYRWDYFRMLPLGFGAIYNHSNVPNAYYLEVAGRPVLIYKATKLIKKGEEIFISYGEEWFSSRRWLCKPSFSDKNTRPSFIWSSISRFIVVLGGLFFAIFFAKFIFFAV